MYRQVSLCIMLCENSPLNWIQLKSADIDFLCIEIQKSWSGNNKELFTGQQLIQLFLSLEYYKIVIHCIAMNIVGRCQQICHFLLRFFLVLLMGFQYFL